MSSSNSRNSSGSDAFYGEFDDDVDKIDEDDLADVQDNISLGASYSSAAEPESESMVGLELDTDPAISYDTTDTSVPRERGIAVNAADSEGPKGYIDEAITRSVMLSADERLKAQNKWRDKRRLKVLLIGILCTVTLIVALPYGLTEVRNEQKLKDTATTYNFDDHEEYKPQERPEEAAGPEEISILGAPFPLAEGYEFPFTLENYLVNLQGPPFDAKKETPFFWQVPSSGAVFQSLMTACYHKVLASNHISPDDDTLEIRTLNGHEYVNVDLSTPDGIDNAANKDLVKSGLADVLVSNHVHFVSRKLLSAKYKGRLFTVIRHPVDRAIANFHHVVSTKPELADMTLEEFAASKHMDKDWFTRFLVNKRQEELVPADLDLAKEILRRKCLVGIHDQIADSLTLFTHFFGWETKRSKAEEHALQKCKDTVLDNERQRAIDVSHRVGKVDKYSPVYKQIVDINSYDMKLYWYAVDMFEELKVRYY